MFWQKRRVEEDLQRIREANIPHVAKEAEERARRFEIARAENGRIGPKDVFAMIIAIFSIIIPYALVFVAVMGLLVAGFSWLMG